MANKIRRFIVYNVKNILWQHSVNKLICLELNDARLSKITELKVQF